MCMNVSVCECVSYPGDIHDLDGCQLPRLNMATLVEGREERDGWRETEDKKDIKRGNMSVSMV